LPSERLAALGIRVGEASGDISLGMLIDQLGPAGIGMALLMLTLPALIPLPGPAGVVLGLLVSAVALQVLCGARRLWMPAWLRRRDLPPAAVAMLCRNGAPLLARAERLLQRRRLLVLTGRYARAVMAVPILYMGIVLALPIPFGNLLPGLSLIAFALGLLVRDGVAMLAGIILAVTATVWMGVLFFAGAELMAVAMAGMADLGIWPSAAQQAR
jgi:hypothetical protein